jgi:hypothetical protein
MSKRVLTPRTRLGHELEQALNEWIDASRRAYHPERDPRDEHAETAAWRRVQSALRSRETPAAA